jgi:PTS system nitrogen regulatory IIA component
MEFREFLAPDAVTAHQRATSRKQLFQDIAARAADVYGIDARAVFEGLCERERLGSTAMGRGVAAPHARLAGLLRICAAFARLEKPLDFDAPDGEPVDLVFALFAPEDAGSDHLLALARVSRALRDPALCAKLRSCADTAALYAVLTESISNRAA